MLFTVKSLQPFLIAGQSWKFVSECYFHNSWFPTSLFLTTSLTLHPLLLSFPISSNGPYSARLGARSDWFSTLGWSGSPFHIAASSLLARGSHPSQELTSTSGELRKPEKTHLSSWLLGSQHLSHTGLWTGDQRTQPAVHSCSKEAGAGWERRIQTMPRGGELIGQTGGHWKETDVF